MIKSYQCYTCQHRGETDICSRCHGGSEFLYERSKRTYVSYNSIVNRYKDHSFIGIKKVIFNDPATIVFWSDGTKTVVKCHDEVFDPEKGLAMAISKKALGNQGNYFNVFKKWTEPYYEKIDTETSDVESLYPSFRLEDAFKEIKENMRRAFENKE